jgi:hypothetical protein
MDRPESDDDAVADNDPSAVVEGSHIIDTNCSGEGVDFANDVQFEQWEETRLGVSRILGSIGAAPLISCPLMSWNLNSSDTGFDGSTIAYLDVTFQLASSHADLIRTISDALELLSTSTSLRLGLGPAHFGSERVVSRSEKTWAERQLNYPRLALSKSRRTLHQTMIDQASTLRAMLTSTLDNAEYAQWDLFISDMQYFSQASQNAPVLTLAKLSVWLNGLRDMLSFVMSQFLSQSCIKLVIQPQNNRWTNQAVQSSQFARERIHFLQSTFKLHPCLEVDCFTLPTSKLSKDKRTGQALKMIHQLHSKLEAAQVSLWAMSQSFLEEQEQSTNSDSEDPNVWCSQLKELLSQTEMTVNHFQSAFLPAPLQNEEATKQEENLPCEIGTTDNIPHTMELVDDTPTNDDVTIANNSSSCDEHADKTWIFSGSGVHKKSQPASGTRKRDHDINQMFDQTMLMRDLQKRLGTLQLAKEHEVVRLDASEDNDSTVAGSSVSERQALPFFMGVEGALMSEFEAFTLHLGKEKEIKTSDWI